jgi:hypothetical protein
LLVPRQSPRKNSTKDGHTTKHQPHRNRNRNDHDEDEDDDDDALLVSTILGASVWVATTVYGTALVFYGQRPYLGEATGYLLGFPGQVHFITMMRAAGYGKLEHAWNEARRNVRQAVRSAIRHAPSLLLARKSLRNLNRQWNNAKEILKETKKAKADGIITEQEERKIRRLHGRTMRQVKRDIRRLKRAMNSIARILDTLDVEELLDLVKGFTTCLFAVLASGSANMYGRFIAWYYHYLNLSSLLLETNLKIGFPLSRMFLTHEMWEENLDEEEARRVKLTGTILMHMLSAYLFLFHHDVGVRLNAAFIGAALLTKGVFSLYETFGQTKWVDLDDDQQETQLFWNGVCTLAFVLLGLNAWKLDIGAVIPTTDGVNDDAPRWIRPLIKAEGAIQRIIKMNSSHKECTHPLTRT